jgi:UPF0716 protein FxsA
MWPFVVLLGWPLLEIALFVVIGGKIGLWATLAWVLLTGVLGVLILRWVAVRQAMALRDLRNPARMAAAGAMGMLGGVLLILPGFFTDALGLLMLLPPVQALVARAIAARITVVRPRTNEDSVIDGEFTDLTPRPKGPSGWTRLD